MLEQKEPVLLVKLVLRKIIGCFTGKCCNRDTFVYTSVTRQYILGRICY